MSWRGILKWVDTSRYGSNLIKLYINAGSLRQEHPGVFVDTREPLMYLTLKKDGKDQGGERVGNF